MENYADPIMGFYELLCRGGGRDLQGRADLQSQLGKAQQCTRLVDV